MCLDWLDERGDGYMDVLLADTCPFNKCLVAVSRLLECGPPQLDELTPAHRHFAGTSLTEADFQKRNFEIGNQIGAQLSYRSRPLKSAPYTDMCLALPDVSDEDKDKMANCFFHASDCCLPKRSLHTFKHVWSGPAQLRQDKRLQRSLRLVGRRLRLSNMVCERLLALFGSAVGGEMKHSSVEKVCSSGLLAQAKTEHKCLGRSNPHGAK